ncbi:MAG: histidine kinase [Lachnospiraceae bacterium]|nr:histidine kinase [Lachnospiraceae bacterium]
MKKHRKLKHRYILRLTAYFFVVSLVPIILFSFITSNITRNKALTEMEQRTDLLLTNMYSGINEEMRVIGERVTNLSREPSIIDFVSLGLMEGETKEKTSGRTNIALYRLYGLTAGLAGYSTTHVVSSEHNAWISTTYVPLCYYPRFTKDWGIFSMAADSLEAVFRINDHNQNMIPNVCFSAACAVRDDDGSVRGYVISDVYRQKITDAMQKYTLDQGQLLYLLDCNDFIVYTNDRSYDPERLNMYTDAPAADEYGYYEEGGNTYYYRSSEKNSYGVRVISVVPIEGIIAASRYIKSAALWAGALCILLAVIFSLIVNKDVAEPLKKLTEAFRLLEAGKLDTRIEDNRKDEFGQLESGFNTMAGKLEELIESIEEKQERLRMAQSSALQAQINPHFLYNTLDLIKWDAKLGNNEEVSKIAVLLGKLLRSMADFEHDIVTVEDELKMIDRYLEIQKIHYGDKLSFSLDVNDSVLPWYIPKLIVQPLVENAVVHGIDPGKPETRVTIKADTDGGYMVFTVTDNGKGMDDETLKELLKGKLTGRTGIGLANVIKRAALYGDESCGVSVRSVPDEGTEVTLRLRPLESPKEASDV